VNMKNDKSPKLLNKITHKSELHKHGLAGRIAISTVLVLEILKILIFS